MQHFRQPPAYFMLPSVFHRVYTVAKRVRPTTTFLYRPTNEVAQRARALSLPDCSKSLEWMSAGVRYPVRVHTCSYYRVLLTVASQLYLPSILVLYTIRYEKKSLTRTQKLCKSIAVLQSGVCEINLAVFVHYLIFFPWIFYRAVFSSDAFLAPP